jgi:hypothetical protein
MRASIEEYFRDPPPGSAAARAADFGIDLTLTIEHLRLTPEERIRKLDNFIKEVANLRSDVELIVPLRLLTNSNQTKPPDRDR